jgi:hypothetical protein
MFPVINHTEFSNPYLQEPDRIVYQINQGDAGTFSLSRNEFLANLVPERVYTVLELKNEFALLVNEVYKAKPIEKNQYITLFSTINKIFDKDKLAFDEAKYVRDNLFHLTSRFYNNPEIYSRIVSLNTKLNKVMSQDLK